MMRVALLVAAFALLAGCEGMNDAMVRRWHQDRQYGYEVNEQMKEGLRRKMEQPAPASSTHKPVPSGLDEG